MKFNIITLGCKVNAYESEAMKELLLKDNYIYNSDPSVCDVVIINTCSVTNMADVKSRKIIRRVRRENPNAILVVCGCSTQNNKDNYKDLGIDILIGNQKKSEIVNLINNYIATKEKIEFINKFFFWIPLDLNLNQIMTARYLVKKNLPPIGPSLYLKRVKQPES